MRKHHHDLTSVIEERKKAKRINSHKKGGDFARKVCKMLNDRFETDEFNKTPGSGAYATTHKLPDHLKVFGDIITPKDFRFCIECKKGYNKEGLNSFFNEKSLLWDFIFQAERDSRNADKETMLLLQQDRKPILALLNIGCGIPYTELKNYLTFSNYVLIPLAELLTFETEYFFQH